MTSKSNLPNRVEKARKAVQFIANTAKDVYVVPGSNGKQYAVRVFRNGMVSFQCYRLHTNNACYGNGNGTVCYHSMAVAEFIAAEQGKAVSWCASEQDAERLARIAGKAFKCVPHNGTGDLWMVVVKDEDKVVEQEARKAEEAEDKRLLKEAARSQAAAFWLEMRQAEKDAVELI